jgi:flagellar hook-associated protein 1 FlgK
MSRPIGSILSVARSALSAHRKAIEVVSHNVSNSATEGYSRQRADLVTGPPAVMPDGVFGSGVRIADVSRARDAVLDRSFRREAGISAGADERLELLSRAEEILNEPTGDGIASDLDAFWSAWSDVANDPTLPTARTNLKSAASTLTRSLNLASERLDGIRDTAELRISDRVDEANSRLEEIASLNEKIVAAEAGGHTAGDLRDARDLALDELASLVSSQAVEEENGAVRVFVGGAAVVDGAEAGQLEERIAASGDLELGVVGRARPIADPGGALGALVGLRNQELPGIRGRLDQVASELVSRVNAVHDTGVNPAGATGVDFFDPAGTTAGTISLSAAVEADAGAIAAGTGDGAGTYLPGSTDVALELAGFRDTAQGPPLDASFGDAYAEFVGEVGRQAAAASRESEASANLQAQAETRRQRVSGVSTDEEMLDLIRHQQAFQAAARLVTTADEMVRSVLTMGA